MKFLELVRKRRSVREYSAQAVDKAVLERCLEAARLAPSACNSQPWFFIVIDNKDIKDRVACGAFQGVYSMNKFASHAPVLVAVITEKPTIMAAMGGMIRNTRYNLIDIGVACEHFCLQAAEEGLGSCMLGWFNEKAVKKILKVPAHKRIDLLISVGYPVEDKDIEKNRKTLESIKIFT